MNTTGHPILDDLINFLKTLPGMGERSALRIGTYLSSNLEKLNDFKVLIDDIYQYSYICECGNIAYKNKQCHICRDPLRDNSQLCIVSSVQDLIQIESTNVYNGLYWVLGGVLSPLKGVGPESLNLPNLLKKIKTNTIKKIFFALGTTVDAKTTTNYIKPLIPKELNINIYDISQNLSFGKEIEFFDKKDLFDAFNNL